MVRLLLALTCATLSLLGQAQPVDRSALQLALSFEAEPAGGAPGGWTVSPAGTVLVDGKVVHGGRWSARIERGSDSTGEFSTITQSIPLDFAGAKIQLRGFLRTEDVTGVAGLAMSLAFEPGRLALEETTRWVQGTNGWAEFAISRRLSRDAPWLVFGAFVAGTGRAWVDDLELLVDGKPVWEAPKAERPKTAVDLDREFDGGSGVILKQLTAAQTANLATLGRVWGFLKYHHPQVAAGRYHWDYELFRILPGILGARDRASANAALLAWIQSLGAVGPCEPCAKLDASDLHLRPALDWIADEALLETELSRSLRTIQENRPAGKQFYVGLAPGTGNAVFDRELAYPALKLPDAGFQLLALYRFWNIIEYWFPYRDVIGEDWGKVLAEFIPRIALATTAEAYQRELMAFIARVHDTHANLWSSIRVRPPTGECRLPVNLRFIENRAVVTGYGAAEAGAATGLKRGDVITELDGVPVARLVETWAPYYAASNDPTRLRDIAQFMTRGDCGRPVTLRGHRDGETFELGAQRPPLAGRPLTHDLPGETFRLLSDEVAYLKLSSVKVADSARYIEAAAKTKGLIIDIRNYPLEFVVFSLGSRRSPITQEKS
jgi:hypothetical protein